MAYNNLVARTGAAALIPEDYSNEIIQLLPRQSAALSLFRQLTMARAQTRMPVLSALPVAYFVNGDTGLKQTTEVDWSNVFLNAEEIATIVPVPEAVLDDQDFDLWGEIRPRLVEAIGRTLDAAIFFGVNKPASWPTAIATAAGTAGNTITRGAANAAAGGVRGDFDAAFATVEADGFDVNGIIANVAYKAYLRAARATTGERLDEGAGPNQVNGIDVTYPMRGLWPTGVAPQTEAILGDFSQGILGLRQDITMKVLDQSVIQDNTGTIIYNLAQQDMVALRVVLRAGFAVPNPITYDQQTGSARYPFAVIHS